MTRSLLTPGPRWCTPRRPDLPTYGPAVGGIARSLRRPFLPWQAQAADTMGEVLPSGRMHYPLSILIIPRRGGKTILTLAQSLQRACIDGTRRVWYTAQSQSDAEEAFREEWVPLVGQSAMAPHVRVRLSNGSKRFGLPSGGQFGTFAPTEQALHGKDSDYVTVDEAWWFSQAKGAHLEAAIRPTMLTRPQRQLVIISAGGTDDSTWLLDWREMGRRLVEENQCSEAGVFYMEFYPPDEDEATLEDPDVWASVHPAVGHTVDLETLRQERATMGPSLFRRSYLNVFSSKAADRILPADDWTACSYSGLVLPEQVTLGYDVDYGREMGSIVACSLLDDGRPAMELVWRGPVAKMTDELERAWQAGHRRLVADSIGPVATVTAELLRRRVRPETLTTQEYATACAEFLDDVKAHRLAMRAETHLDTAAANTAKRELGDGFAWTRKGSGAGISPVVAATVGLHRARQRKPAKRGRILVAS